MKFNRPYIGVFHANNAGMWPIHATPLPIDIETL